ncbi:14982_t:CDS:2 [Dentiscutata heterogama]|uniref:14982_t:CDS:1 n=1 Tax=Dentiscutata heterogama TaxID=1316150 RepID=A0ACA9M560_9GLOM|nr:14982_t:CDS:2 [Dentiscutata heterogama]
MSNDINPKKTINVLLVYLLQLQHLAIQSIEKKHHDFLVKNNVQKKKPSCPPNAFILYHQAKQLAIVATSINISNNKVSKRVSDMWHKESLKVKIKFQLLADIAKLEHMQKYSEYKYQPRCPHEKKRRTKRNCHLSINEISS